MGNHLDTKQLAERLGRSQQVVRTWRMRGTGPSFIRTGSDPRRGRVLYALADILAWEESRKAISTSQESARGSVAANVTAAQP